MPNYAAPLRDMRFVLFELFNAEALWASLPKTADVTRELADAVLEESAKICGELIAPLNASGDAEGVHWDDGVVTTPKGFKQAFNTYREGGWIGLAGDPAYGGQGMPKLLSLMCEEMLSAANVAFALYPGLSIGAALSLLSHGSDAQKDMYLPRLYSGEWAGVMCLTEAHAGSDLGIIRTHAEAQADGSYSLSGTKIFITGGEQDLTDNIIYLVLAKLPDAPAGTKGISLFIVPKFLHDADGKLGARNGVRCGSIEHKMGIHASSTCVINFDGATGYLIGELNKGLAYMFTMMNYERLGVGLQGLGCSERSYQGALAYARDRLQGRVPGSKNAADPIIAHADVRRMLLTQKAFNEGGRAFAAYVGIQLDIAKFGDGETRQLAENKVALLTPIAKAFLTDKGFEGCVLGQQVFGGHGYVREWGMEQLVRDARIAQIYEGTNGIQAMDLIGRKVLANNGRFLLEMRTEIIAFCDAAAADHIDEFIAPVRASIKTLEKVTFGIIEAAQKNPDAVGAAAVDYLNVFGLAMYAYLWARTAQVAKAKLTQDGDGFYQSKLHTAQFYMVHCLPQIDGLARSISGGPDSVMALSAEHFAY
ncbi:MAG: acyl-CoA dehydrogenase [Verrucomicrobiaceae bacterium]|nr:acyl-CoA dehydrogenase [Verrucomicrobiaceae bacterium]